MEETLHTLTVINTFRFTAPKSANQYTIGIAPRCGIFVVAPRPSQRDSL